MSREKTIVEFGRAPIKVEGAPIDPDYFIWECDLSKCDECRTKYEEMKIAYKAWEKEWDERYPR